MALIARKGLCELTSPFLQFKRFRGKINFKRPRPPHFERAVYIELTKPILPSSKYGKTIQDLCRGFKPKKHEEQENILQKFIAKELNRWFHESRLIAFFHRNPMDADDELRAFNLFKKQKMHYKNYGRKTMEMAIKGTKFEPVLQLYVSHNMVVFSKEPELKKLLSTARKIPQLTLLAAVLEGHFLHVEDVKKYSLIPNLQTAQMQLVQTLNAAGGTLVQQLFTHQQQLSIHLDQIAEELKKEEKK